MSHSPLGHFMHIATDFDNAGLSFSLQPRENVFDIWPYSADEYREYIKLAPRRPHDRVLADAGERDGTDFFFHFCLHGRPGQTATLRFHFRETIPNFPVSLVYANPDMPVMSLDGDRWDRMDRKTLADDPDRPGWKIVTVEHTLTAERVFIASQYPYSNDHLTRFLEDASRSPGCKVETIGHSTEGRDIRMMTIADPPTIHATDPRCEVWFIGMQHCAETGAGWGIEGAAEFLLSDDAAAREALRRCVFRFVPIVNVDGVAEGRGRLHPTNRNLNREWERDTPEVPEVTAVRGAMDRLTAAGRRPDFFIDFHGFSSLDDENWLLLTVPDACYDAPRLARYQQARDSLAAKLPFKVQPNEHRGYAAGMAARRFGAISFSVDGFVYRWPARGVAPSLASYYGEGRTIWPVETIKAAGMRFVDLVVEAMP